MIFFFSFLIIIYKNVEHDVLLRINNKKCCWGQYEAGSIVEDNVEREVLLVNSEDDVLLRKNVWNNNTL